jgi:uncharacterized protein (DUF983 family)
MSGQRNPAILVIIGIFLIAVGVFLLISIGHWSSWVAVIVGVLLSGQGLLALRKSKSPPRR